MPPIPPVLLYEALAALARLAPAVPPLPELMTRTITIAERVEAIREALRAADSFVLQDLLEGVRDRIVRAVTFLAMLELVKQREIVVEQAEPWGPIVARRWTPTPKTTPEPAPEPTPELAG
jgi:chromatin segregation and condensation protein Rec8/ScpA/Scc1 (kleisin family)